MVPAITPTTMTGISMGMVAVRMIAVFFACEVIIEESRGRNRSLAIVVVSVLVIVGLKWLCSDCLITWLG